MTIELCCYWLLMKQGRIGQVMKFCPPGARVVAKQLVREYYALCCVAPELGQMTTLVLPDANQMMNLFLGASLSGVC